MHNGFIDGYAKYKRDLAFAVEPEYYPLIRGTTDSELMFFLALTFGLQDDPPEALARTIGLVEAVGRQAGVQYPYQGTIVTSDGESMWAFRYSSEGKSRTLFFTRDVPTLRKQYPDTPVLRKVSDDARLVVSEPVGNLPGAWEEVPEASYSVVRQGDDALRPFVPRPPD
jgi:glutamine amidotransferase